MAHLPERPGFTVEHLHDIGEPCVFDGPEPCMYLPTLWNRIKSYLLGKLHK